MPPGPRRFPSARRRTMHRRTLWATTNQLAIGLAAATNITPIDLLAPLRVVGVGVIGGTVVRTHVNIAVTSADTDGGPGIMWGTVMYDKGIVGPAVPNVTNDFNVDWAMLRYLTPGTSANSLVRPENAPTGSTWGREYDVKSRRRIHEVSDSYMFCFGNLGSVAITYSILIRVLVQIP